MSGERIEADGLDGVALGELAAIEGGGLALVTALRRDSVELAALVAMTPRRGARVDAHGPLRVPCGDDVLGRVIDATGAPLDGGPPLERLATHAVMFRDPTIVRGAAPRRLTLGLLAYDLQHLMHAGTSVLAIGAAHVAPAGVLVDDVVRHQLDDGRACIVAMPRAVSPSPCRASLVVAAPADATDLHRWLVPWTALAIADGWRARGRDVVVVLDSLDDWAPAVAAFDSCDSWPTQVAQLAAHAYADARGAVSLIALRRDAPDVDTRAGFDQIVDLAAAASGEIARLRTKLVRPPIGVPSRAELGGALATDAARAAMVREALRWRPGTRADLVEQTACLVAVLAVASMPVEQARAFIDDYLVALRHDHAPCLAELRRTRVMTVADRAALVAAAAALVR